MKTVPVTRGIALLTALVAVLAVFFCSTAASAQEVESIRIQPAIVEDRVDPGSRYEFRLRVTNNSDAEKVYYLGAEDIQGVDDRGAPIFTENGEPTEYELSTWIRIPQESVTVGAGQSQEVPFSVEVPQDASPGSHFAGVFFDLRPPKLRTSGASIGMRVASIVSLRIAGEVVEEARLRELSTDKLIYNDPMVTFNVNVENTGNVLVRPHGLIKVANMFGKEVASIRVNDSLGALFPMSQRIFTIEWEDDEFAFGRYQAVVGLVYGEDGRKSITGTTSFWVLPLKPILWAMGSIVGFFLLLYISMRFYIQRKLKELGVVDGRRGASYYSRRYSRSASRLMITVIAVTFLCLVLLFTLFLMFA